MRYNNSGQNIQNNYDNSLYGYTVQTKYCADCGAEMSNDADFCPNCGAAVGESNASPQDVYYNQPPEKKSNIVVPVIIFGIVFIVFLTVAVLAYVYLNKEHDADDSTGKKNKAPAVYSSENNSDEVDFPIQVENEIEEDEEDDATEEVSESDDYLFPSDTQYITEAYLDTLSKDDVAFIRNEIYARHGYMFKTEPYKTYFSNKYWYVPNPDFNEKMFNSIEKANKDLIVAYEEKMGWR